MNPAPEQPRAIGGAGTQFKFARLLLAGLFGLLISLAVAASLACGGDDGDSDRAATSVSGGRRTPEAATPEATIDISRTPVAPPQTDAPPPGQNPGDKLVIGKIGVDAPLSYKAVGLDAVMPDPNGPDDVAFYDFSALAAPYGGVPGVGGNIVMSGHVDFGRGPCKSGTVPPPCEAVFWDLDDLRVGDIIEIHYQGQVFRYSVTANQQVGTDANWDAIVGSTSTETLTLITCEGTFNSSTREYSDRRVVTAERTA